MRAAPSSPLRLLVLGRGKTGALVADVARERGHNVRALGAAENEDARALTQETLREIDMVIDFTTPDAVLPNITACSLARASMVVGTTGWHVHAQKVRELVEATDIGFVYGSNFSVGVNLFFEVAQTAATALKLGYTGRIMERHHAQKKDSPSGTAVTLRNLVAEAAPGAEPMEIASIREGDTVGMHVLLLDSAHDTMMLTHDAKSRRGFAEGAVRAAEWLHGKKGFYEFHQIFREL